MSFNGSGSFLINTAGQPVVSGTVISSTAFNALTADLATGLSTCITKDGQTTVTANIPMANYKFTGLGAGSGAADSANLSQVQSTVVKLLASVSGTDTITAVGSPTVSAYAAGQMFYFVAAGDNTGAVTINIDSLGAKAVTRDGSVALVAGDIKSGEVVVIVYDGTRFQVVSQLNSAGNATFANVSITSALNVGGVATFSAGTAAAPSITTSGDTNNGIFFPATDVTAITTAGSERLRVDSSGNLGLGVTPSAWLSGAKVFQFGSTSALSDTQARYTDLLSNCYVDTAGNVKYLTTGNATIYSQNRASGIHAWYTAASGTAGNTVSLTQAMTLDASGNLGVGTTSPANIGAGYTHLEINNTTSGVLSVSVGGTRTLSLACSSSDARIESRVNGGSMQFFTNGGSVTERARITSDGNFYVNTTGAGGKVYVVSDLTSNNGLRVDTPASFTSNSIALICGTAAGTGWNFLYGESSGGSNRIQIRGDGNVYNANGTYGTISDARLKQDIVDAGSQWDDLKAIRFRKYRMKSDVEADPNAPALFGVVAQELEQVCPGLVDDGEIKTVKSSILLMKAAKALQEAMARIEQLEAKVAALETK